VAAAGVGRTFQNLRLFERLTALENVLVALEAAPSGALAGLHPSRQPANGPAEARRLLEVVGLAAVADCQANQLAYGERRRLEISRALALGSWLLLLDEPAAGLNLTEKSQLKQLLLRIRDSGVSLVLIEHEMTLVMDISDHVLVMANGRKIAEGKPSEVRREPAVVQAYLGTIPESSGHAGEPPAVQ
jgi:branched-chain amino acid transport system ATP-binding protein